VLMMATVSMTRLRPRIWLRWPVRGANTRVARLTSTSIRLTVPTDRWLTICR